MAIGGDGGDELFGGYEHYSRLMWMEKYLGAIPHPTRLCVAFASQHIFPIGFKGRNYLQGLGAD